MTTDAPSTPTPASEATWAGAADALAARVARRERRGAALQRIGLVLMIAATAAIAWRAVGPATSAATGRQVVLAILAAGLLLAIPLARRAARRTAPVDAGQAAWALDRIAGAEGRGLAAAAARGAAASEAAFAGMPLGAPPGVRLHPPAGLTLLVGALLLSTLAFLAPAREIPASTEARSTSVAGSRAAGEGGESPGSSAAERAEGRAKTLQAQADAAAAVRKALNLPADGPLDPKEVASRLADPQARSKAAEAAGDGSALAEALGGSETSGDAVARLIERGEDNQDAASRERRDAARARARAGVPAVPPARRDVVKHYLRLIDQDRDR